MRLHPAAHRAARVTPSLPAAVLALAVLALDLPALASSVEDQAEGSAAATHRVTSQAGLVAAYLYNFTKYIEWPAASFPQGSQRVTIGVVGDRGVHHELAQIDGKATNGRTLQVRWFATAAEAQACQVLYLGAAEPGEWALLRERLAGQPVLSVSPPDAPAGGAVVRMFMEQNKLRFEIDLAQSQSAGLTISSHLLRLARVRSGATAAGQASAEGQ